jgi:hypothetical protein
VDAVIARIITGRFDGRAQRITVNVVAILAF